MTYENKQVVQTIEALVEYKEAKRIGKALEAFWRGAMLLSIFVLMLLALIIFVVFNDWVIANKELLMNVMKYGIISIILLTKGIGLWQSKQIVKYLPDYENYPWIDQSLYLKLSILSNDSFLYTANELLKENGLDKQIIQLEDKKMLLV